jgi:hypothetical protein
MRFLSFKTIIVLFASSVILLSCKNTNSNRNPSSDASENNSWENLFNGENLDGWYTYQMRPEPTSEVPGLGRDDEGNYLEPIGLNKDPLQVFTVVTEDEAPAIRISGEVFGILVTGKEFENYHLSVQFKWGTAKHPPRTDQKRDSGVLYHSVGKEGAWYGVWMRSVECQVQEGDCGDYYSVDTVLADIPAALDEETEQYMYTPGAEVLTFSPEMSVCHRSNDYENPTGEWNTIEIYAVGDRSVHIINGHVNNRISNIRQIIDGREVPLTRGKIQLQSEGAEVFYRNIRISSIDKIPDEYRAVQ